MVGRDENVHRLGIAPCSIAWLFKLIDEKRERCIIGFHPNFQIYVYIIIRMYNSVVCLHHKVNTDEVCPITAQFGENVSELQGNRLGDSLAHLIRYFSELVLGFLSVFLRLRLLDGLRI